MASMHSYEGWWDLSLIDDRNERPLHAAFVAVITGDPLRVSHRRVVGLGRAAARRRSRTSAPSHGGGAGR
jgi:hypothetical protein